MRSFCSRLTTAFLVLLVGSAALRLVAIGYRLPWLIHDPLVYLPTWSYVIPGLGILVVADRRRWVPRWMSVVAVAVLAANLACDFHLSLRTPRASAEDIKISLISYNIYQARWEDDRLLPWIEAQQPDILFLQEVPARFYAAHENALRRMFPNVVYRNHLLIATRLNVLAMNHVDLSNRRSLLHTVLEVEGTRFDALTTHLSVALAGNFLPRLQTQQCQTAEVLAHLSSLSGPFVIAGDFNVPLHSTAYKQFARLYQDARSVAGETGFGYTFNTCLPITTIDHCFGSAGIQFLQRQAMPVWLSDHRPIRIDFAIPRR